MSKKLVVYFSHKGENYSKGKIINLEKGNTEVVVEMIYNITGADIFEIIADKKYPIRYDDCTEIAKKELRENSRPKLKDDIDIKEYDTIFMVIQIGGGLCLCQYGLSLKRKILLIKKFYHFVHMKEVV